MAYSKIIICIIIYYNVFYISLLTRVFWIDSMISLIFFLLITSGFGFIAVFDTQISRYGSNNKIIIETRFSGNLYLYRLLW